MFNINSLKIKLTIVISLVLIGTITILTVITFKNVDNQILEPIQNFEDNRPVSDSVQSKDMSDVAPVVISPATEIKRINNEFRVSYVYWMIGIAVVGILVSYYLIQKNLKSLNELKTDIQQVNEHRLSSRLVVPNHLDEVGQLSQEYNLMLDRLEESFAYQKTFAENAAHELKTPLSIMKLSFQVLELDEEKTLEALQEHQELTKENVDRLIDIVDQLLLVSTNTKSQNIEEFSLDMVMLDLMKDSEKSAAEKKIKLICNGDNMKLMGNRVLITLAIKNVLINAIKYTPENGKITINYYLKSDIAMIEILDTGIGIKAENMPYLFEPFYRVEESRTRNLGGSGLGLTLTKKIIEMHNGRISVESKMNQGTKFSIKIPIVS